MLRNSCRQARGHPLFRPVESLARECGISRSVLAERFTHYVGQSPMHYLGRWRMALAAGMLRTSALAIAQIAKDVGYETDPAFTRAFRREFGMPPAAWRAGVLRPRLVSA